MKHHRIWLATTGLIAALSLAGCWDDDNNNDPVPLPPPVAIAEVPDSAGLSTGAFVSYLLGLSATDESTEPLSIKDTFAVPADESNEPTLLS